MGMEVGVGDAEPTPSVGVSVGVGMDVSVGVGVNVAHSTHTAFSCKSACAIAGAKLAWTVSNTARQIA